SRLMATGATTVPAIDHLDTAWHRQLLDQLCGFDRESASAGERAAAEWLARQLEAQGAADVRLEEERGHQTFWWPLGLTAIAGVAAGLKARDERNLAAAVLGVSAAWAAADELPPRRRVLRKLLPKRSATNAIASAG